MSGDDKSYPPRIVCSCEDAHIPQLAEAKASGCKWYLTVCPVILTEPLHAALEQCFGVKIAKPTELEAFLLNGVTEDE